MIGLVLITFLIFEVTAQNFWSSQKQWLNDETKLLTRMPQTVEVLRYDLRLQPFFPFPNFAFHSSKMMSFEGKINITFRLLNSTQQIKLNSAGLLINQADFWRGNDRLTTRFSVERQKPVAVVNILEETLEANVTHVLRLHFSGKINQFEVRGLFANNYVDEKGKQRTMLATLFEPNHARRMFPCFDNDIRLKAVFQLTLVHPRNASVLHNTLPETTTNFGDQLQITIFKPTPKIPPYLFGFSIGDFAIASAVSKSGVKVRSISLKHLGEHLNRSAEIAVNAIDYFESVLKVKFPSEKLDNLESSNLQVGAVESWGLSIFRGLLSVPTNVTSNIRLAQMLLISHEVVHSYFGNLVTAEDFSLMFLHEGFAQYLMTQCLLTNELSECKQWIERSVRSSTVNLVLMVKKTPSCKKIFADLTYKAGAAVIGQLEAVVGKETFYSALKFYITKNQFRNANLNSLIWAFEKVIKNESLCDGITIRSFLEDLLLRSGYPIVDVQHSSNGYSFKQRASDGSNRRWNVPLLIRKSSGNKLVLWLKKDGSLCNKGIKQRLQADKTYVFNYMGRGFLRFNYDDEAREKLLDSISLMDQTTQYALIVDILNQKTGVEETEAQKFVERIVDETINLSPLLAKQLTSIYKPNALKPLIEKLCSTIQWDPKSLSQGVKTYSLLHLAAQFGLCNVTSKAEPLFREFVSECFTSSDILKCNKINPDIRQAVYCNAMKRRNAVTLSNYALWMNVTPQRVHYDYDELPNVRHALKCR
ncbi:hypothetical protein M3Y98_00036400 [Aphelenchoides besseyi]|nr:hypothetical protein M3Y98_00036400 [Aphelenchoides besseyi]